MAKIFENLDDYYQNAGRNKPDEPKREGNISSEKGSRPRPADQSPIPPEAKAKPRPPEEDLIQPNPRRPKEPSRRDQIPISENAPKPPKRSGNIKPKDVTPDDVRRGALQARESVTPGSPNREGNIASEKASPQPPSREGNVPQGDRRPEAQDSQTPQPKDARPSEPNRSENVPQRDARPQASDSEIPEGEDRRPQAPERQGNINERGSRPRAPRGKGNIGAEDRKPEEPQREGFLESEDRRPQPPQADPIQAEDRRRDEPSRRDNVTAEDRRPQGPEREALEAEDRRPQETRREENVTAEDRRPQGPEREGNVQAEDRKPQGPQREGNVTAEDRTPEETQREDNLTAEDRTPQQPQRGGNIQAEDRQPEDPQREGNVSTEDNRPQEPEREGNLTAEDRAPEGPRREGNLRQEDARPEVPRREGNIEAEDRIPQQPQREDNVQAEDRAPEQPERAGNVTAEDRDIEDPRREGNLTAEDRTPEDAFQTGNIQAEDRRPTQPRREENVPQDDRRPDRPESEGNVTAEDRTPDSPRREGNLQAEDRRPFEVTYPNPIFTAVEEEGLSGNVVSKNTVGPDPVLFTDGPKRESERVRTTSDEILDLQTQARLNQFEAFFDLGRGANDQPFILRRPESGGGSSFVQNVKKQDSRTAAPGSISEDVVRLGKFFASGQGLLYNAKQQFLQNLNPRKELKIYDPTSPVRAGANSPVDRFSEGVTRHLSAEQSFIGTLASEAAELLGFGDAIPQSSDYEDVIERQRQQRTGDLAGQGGYLVLTSVGHQLPSSRLESLVGSQFLSRGQAILSNSITAVEPLFSGDDTGIRQFAAGQVIGGLGEAFLGLKRYDPEGGEDSGGFELTDTYNPTRPYLRFVEDVQSTPTGKVTDKVRPQFSVIDPDLRVGTDQPLSPMLVHTTAQEQANAQRQGGTSFPYADYFSLPPDSLVISDGKAQGRRQNLTSSAAYFENVAAAKEGAIPLHRGNLARKSPNRGLPNYSAKTEDGQAVSKRLDRINLLGVISSEEGQEEVYGNERERFSDLVPFKFFDVRNKKLLVFRAFVSGISDNTSPEWSQIDYAGRPEKGHRYGGNSRTLSFNFKTFPFSREEFNAQWEKLNYLYGLTYPAQYQEARGGGSYMVPPFVKLTIGDMYNQTYGYINSLSYTVNDEVEYELENGSRLPRAIDVSVGYQVIENRAPATGQKFFDAAFLEELSEQEITREAPEIIEPDPTPSDDPVSDRAAERVSQESDSSVQQRIRAGELLAEGEITQEEFDDRIFRISVQDLPLEQQTELARLRQEYGSERDRFFEGVAERNTRFESERRSEDEILNEIDSKIEGTGITRSDVIRGF